MSPQWPVWWQYGCWSCTFLVRKLVDDSLTLVKFKFNLFGFILSHFTIRIDKIIMLISSYQGECLPPLYQYIWRRTKTPKFTRVKDLDIWNILTTFLDFGLLKLTILRFGLALWRHCDWHYTLDVRTYFGMYGKRRPIAILWYQLDIFGVHFWKSQVVVTTPW